MCTLHGKKRISKKDRKGWCYDKILVHLKEFRLKYMMKLELKKQIQWKIKN